MATVTRGRVSAAVDDEGVVLFLIGMRVNAWWRLHQWVPVAAAMPRMIIELRRQPSLGLLAAPRSYVSGRTIMVIQYWRSFDHLASYARSKDNEHLPAWRRFNTKVADNGAVGIFHETYLVSPSSVESIYANTPPFGLALATTAVPTKMIGQSAGRRLRVIESDDTPVDPY